MYDLETPKIDNMINSIKATKVEYLLPDNMALNDKPSLQYIVSYRIYSNKRPGVAAIHVCFNDILEVISTNYISVPL